MAALNIPSVQVVLRRALFSAFRDAFRGEHRLRYVLLSSLARVALDVPSACNTSSLVIHMFKLCGGELERLLRIAGGRVSRELVDVPSPVCGIVDSLRWLLHQNSAGAWDLIRLLVMPQTEAACFSSVPKARNQGLRPWLRFRVYCI